MTEEIRYIAKLQRQEEFDNEVTELKDELTRLEQENKQMKSVLEEINLILDELKQQYDYMTDYSEIKEIQDKINEVSK